MRSPVRPYYLSFDIEPLNELRDLFLTQTININYYLILLQQPSGIPERVGGFGSISTFGCVFLAGFEFDIQCLTHLHPSSFFSVTRQ